MMNGHLENNDNGILNFILNNQEHFINVLERFNNDYSKIPECLTCHKFNKIDNIDSLLIYTDEGRFYPLIKNHYIDNVIDIISNTDKIFTLYGDTNHIKEITDSLQRKILSSCDYYVMMLKKNDWFFTDYNIDDYDCIKCNDLSFNRLKDLQYAYHMEEVYKDSLNYPYYVEMSSYKKILKEKINYAVFNKKKDIAVSKANVNAESPDFFQLGGIFTKKEYRQKGLAKLCLVNLINDIFTNTNKKGILLFVNIENIPAVNLYKKLGFKVILNSTLCYF